MRLRFFLHVFVFCYVFYVSLGLGDDDVEMFSQAGSGVHVFMVHQDILPRRGEDRLPANLRLDAP